MVLTASQMIPLGTPAPEFALPDTDGVTRTFGDVAAGRTATVVVFLCNHCPYVIHIRKELAAFAKAWQGRNVGFVGINSNDVENYPDDSPEKMKQEVAEVGYTFPYLFDGSQAIAKAYSAACTPDFFVFDHKRHLVYRGQFDDARPGNDAPITGADLANALEAVTSGEPAPQVQKPSMGCNIKWKPGNAPDYFGA